MHAAHMLRINAYAAVMLAIAVPTSIPAPPFANAKPAAPLTSSTVQTWTETNDDCVATVEEHNLTAPENEVVPTDVRTSTISLEVSAPQPVRDDDLLPSDAAAPSDLRSAVVAGTVTSRYFKQTVVHGTDQETQSGIFHFNGARAWIQTYAGYTGSHRCWVNYTVGYSVSVTSCVGGASGNPSTVRMGLQVKPFNAPISWNEDHYVYLRPNGTYYW